MARIPIDVITWTAARRGVNAFNAILDVFANVDVAKLRNDRDELQRRATDLDEQVCNLQVQMAEQQRRAKEERISLTKQLQAQIRNVSTTETHVAELTQQRQYVQAAHVQFVAAAAASAAKVHAANHVLEAWIAATTSSITVKVHPDVLAQFQTAHASDLAADLARYGSCARAPTHLQSFADPSPLAAQ